MKLAPVAESSVSNIEMQGNKMKKKDYIDWSNWQYWRCNCPIHHLCPCLSKILKRPKSVHSTITTKQILNNPIPKTGFRLKKGFVRGVYNIVT